MGLNKLFHLHNNLFTKYMLSTCNRSKILNWSMQTKLCHYDAYDDFDNFEQDNYRPQRYNRNEDRGYRNEDRGYRNERSSFNQYSSRMRDNFQSRGGNRGRSSFQMDLQRPNWNSMSLPPVEKDFYVPSESVKEMSQEEIDEYRKTHNMTVDGNDIPAPIQTFSDYKFPESITDIFSSNKFEKPSPIQSQGWPIALSGRDLVGIGQTGSGKTLGFILPAIVHISHQPPLRQDDGPIALIMSPTRELAQQINGVASKAIRGTRTRSACLFGGASKGSQLSQLRNSPSICVATPGRLLDFLSMGVTNLQRCTYLVLDEADCMLDMGFEPQIRSIVDQIRPDRQTLMWSATWPKDVRMLAGDFLTDSVKLTVGSTELSANPDVSQCIEVCAPFDKIPRFKALVNTELQENPKAKILVFCETKSNVDFITRELYNNGIKAKAIHGDHSQTSRDNTLQGFRNNKFPVLVATNVAARGLDVNDISVVMNFEFPRNIEDYVHRIGRTGRAGKSGKSISLLTGNDANMVEDLVKILKKSNNPIPEELYDLQSSGYESNRGNRSSGRNNRNRYRNRNF